jgi:hypothetical protein
MFSRSHAEEKSERSITLVGHPKIRIKKGGLGAMFTPDEKGP